MCLKNTKCYLVLLCILSFYSAFAQYTKTTEYNPEKLLEESRIFEEKSRMSLIKAEMYQKEGSLFLDSTRFIGNMIKMNPNPEFLNYLVSQFEANYKLAYKFIAMADSMAILAENFRDISINKTKEAFAQMGRDVQVSYNKTYELQPEDIPKNTSHYEPSSTNTIKPNNEDKNQNNIGVNYLFVLQMGAGNMNMNYFSKIPEIKTVQCRDGINRYVIPGYFSKEDAYKKREELAKLGYQEIFIRTKESLEKIAN